MYALQPFILQAKWKLRLVKPSPALHKISYVPKESKDFLWNYSEWEGIDEMPLIEQKKAE